MKVINVEELDYNKIKKLKEATGISIYRLFQTAIQLLQQKYKQELEEYERTKLTNQTLRMWLWSASQTTNINL